MEKLSDFVGTDVYCDGKKIGRITDFYISPREKRITGFSGLTTSGLIRNEFFVSRAGILHIDKNGCVVDNKKLFFKRNYAEEYGEMAVFSTGIFADNSIGDIYFEPENLNLERISIKKSFFDDIIFGRETVDINDVTISKKGIIKLEGKR
jgi:uncharacterized protein YrrD